MDAPFFSIVIPTFNSGKTLADALQSINIQSFRDFEVLILDSNSTDDTERIATCFIQNNPEIMWMSEKDKGIYDAMNKGVRLSKGEWLYFLGSDDKLFDRDVLGHIHKNISHNSGVDVIYGNVFSTLFNGIYDGEFSNEKIFKKNICHQSIFIKKHVFRKVGNFNNRYKGFADWDHNLRWFLCPKIKKQFVNLIVAHYGAEGFTSIKWDSVFGNEKQFNYLLYGSKVLPFTYKVLTLWKEFVNLARLKKVKRLMRLIINTPRILIPVF